MAAREVVAMTISFLMQQYNLVGNRGQAHLLMMSLIRHLSWCLSFKESGPWEISLILLLFLLIFRILAEV